MKAMEDAFTSAETNAARRREKVLEHVKAQHAAEVREAGGAAASTRAAEEAERAAAAAAAAEASGLESALAEAAEPRRARASWPKRSARASRRRAPPRRARRRSSARRSARRRARNWRASEKPRRDAPVREPRLDSTIRLKNAKDAKDGSLLGTPAPAPTRRGSARSRGSPREKTPP